MKMNITKVKAKNPLDNNFECYFIVKSDQMEWKIFCVQCQVNSIMFEQKYMPCHNPTNHCTLPPLTQTNHLTPPKFEVLDILSSVMRSTTDVN